MAPVQRVVLDGLSKGIQQELAAYVFYKRGIKITKSERVRELLIKLAGEEKDHYRILEGQYDNLVRSEMWNTYTDVLRKPGLPDIDEKITDFQSVLIDEVSEPATPMRILEIGLTLEIAARDLYVELAENIDDLKGKETYIYLSKFEQGHINKIKRMMDELE